MPKSFKNSQKREFNFIIAFVVLFFCFGFFVLVLCMCVLSRAFVVFLFVGFVCLNATSIECAQTALFPETQKFMCFSHY